MMGRGECSKRSKSEKLSKLPIEIWKYIIQLVATISLQSTMELHFVSKLFKELVDDSSTFAVIDMDGFGGGYRHTGNVEEARQVQIFTNRCWEAKNPESLFQITSTSTSSEHTPSSGVLRHGVQTKSTVWSVS